MKDKNLKVLIVRISKKYVQAPISLRVSIGEILEGKIELNYKKNK